MMGMKREKGPYQAKDNGDTRKTEKKDHKYKIRIELRPCLSGSYTVSPTCSALRAVVRKSKVRGRDS